MNPMIVQPVILCGGSGTRLWPLSRAGFPKQFLCLTGSESLFQMTLARITSLQDAQMHLKQALIVTGEEHRFIAMEQLREMNLVSQTLLLEPVAKNTAPALTLAAHAAIEEGEDPILVVMPADHHMDNQLAFHETLRDAVHQAQLGALVILGVQPTRPETGYGYIQRDPEGSDLDIARVIAFKEKPDLETAVRFLQDGNYLWNAGIFVLKASLWLKAIEMMDTAIAEITFDSWQKRTQEQLGGYELIRPSASDFHRVPHQSIDYAVIEKCSQGDVNLVVCSLKPEVNWNDLGSWDSVWNHKNKDELGNVLQGDVFIDDSESNLVHASSRLVSLLGVNNLIVIETPDAVLVADRLKSQEIKKAVDELHLKNRKEAIGHRKVYRPWGWYDTVDVGDRFKVKRIQVNPGASISLQKHEHRAEHWVVVQGEAEVTCGTSVKILYENQSTYIPCGELHRLKNVGQIPLEIVEIQTGNLLMEDDIHRYEDVYGR